MTEETLLRTPLAFPRDFGEPLLLAVVPGGAGQTAVQALGHGLWVVVTARAGELGSMPGACQETPPLEERFWFATGIIIISLLYVGPPVFDHVHSDESSD